MTALPRSLALGLLLLPMLAAHRPADAQSKADEQSVLGPGLYVFQMRIRNASCADASRTGHVTTFVAPVHGIPGSRTMEMELLNSPYWPKWTLTVSPTGDVVATAQRDGKPDGLTNQFEVSLDGNKFTGRGSRSYMATVGGNRRRCVVTYDALLRRLDT
jgi:hypothetical protein